MMHEAYSISSLFTILVTLFFGCVIFFRGRGGRVAESYFLLMVCLALWAAGMYNAVTSFDAARAFFWIRFLFIFAAFIPAFYFRFLMRMLGQEKQYRFLLRLGYFISFCLAVSMPASFMLKGATLKLGAYWPNPGKFFFLYVVFLAGYPALAHKIVHTNRRELTHLAKKQLIYVSIAAVLGFGGGVSTLLPAYGIFIPRLESFFIFLVPFSCAFIAIATYTARLMDIDFLRRRAFIFSLLYGLTVGLFVSLVFIVQNILRLKYDINRFIFPISALFIITIFIRPIENLLVHFTDKFLYQKKYNYQKILEQASKGMLFITNKERLIKLVVRVLSKHMRLTNAAVFLYNEDKAIYKCVDARSKNIEMPDEIKSTSALTEWLKEKKAPLLTDDITNWLQKEAIFPHRVVLKRTLEQLRVMMRSLDATVCVPAFTGDQLIGFLVLGDKLSGVGYTKDDIALLSTLSNSAAIAVENSHMYDELHLRIQRVAELLKEQHELFIDTATAFSYVVDSRDTYSRQHTQRIIGYCMVIIRGLDRMNAGYSKDPQFMEDLKIAALLHDVGKVAIPDDILNKESPLTPEERKIIENHINIAVTILKPIEELGSVINIVKYHHEFYNGSGYPEGKKADDIPFASRILSVANAYDAMTSNRPYRKALTHQRAAERLKEGAGKDFDPLIVNALLIGFEGLSPTKAGEIRTSRGEFPPILY